MPYFKCVRPPVRPIRRRKRGYIPITDQSGRCAGRGGGAHGTAMGGGLRAQPSVRGRPRSVLPGAIHRHGQSWLPGPQRQGRGG
eukprot:4062596-Pyramimonas_sp.AAC.1